MKSLKYLLLCSLLFVSKVYSESIQDLTFSQPQSSSLSTNLNSTFGIQESPLSASEAFKLSAKIDNKNLTFDFLIADNHYLYTEQFELYVNGNKKELKIDNAIEKEDMHYGKVKVIKGFNTFSVNVEEDIKNYKLIYQGCSEKFNICYDKITYDFFIPEHTVVKEDNIIKKQEEGIVEEKVKEDNIIKKQEEGIVEEKVKIDSTLNNSLILEEKIKIDEKELSSYKNSEAYIKDLLSNSELWQILLFFFFGGVLISFTPCVLPMIPIVSSIVLGKQENITQLKAFSLSLSYVIGSSVTYALLGLTASLLSENIQAYMQNIYVIISFSLILILLGASMFGVFNINGSQKLNNIAYEYSNKLKGGEHIQVFIMGMLSTLILSPCVAAPIAAAITYISTTNDILTGTLSMFIFGLGIGSVLILITTTLNKFKIKSGQWMNEIKYLTGLIIILVAVYLLSNIVIDQSLIYIAYSTIVFTYLVSFYARNYEKMKWLIIILLLSLVGILYFKPSNMDNISQKIEYKKVFSIQELDEELKDNKYTILKFTADWCVYCKQMDKDIFKNKDYLDKFKNYDIIYVDVTKENENTKKLKEKYNVFAPPVIVFLENDDIVFKETGYNRNRLIEIINLINQNIDKLKTGEKNGRQ